MSDAAHPRGPLRWYAVVWLAVWAPTGFVTCLAGLMVGPRGPLLAMGGLAAVTAALAVVPLDPRLGSAGLAPVLHWAAATTAARRAVFAGSGVVLVGALVSLVGAMVFPLVAVVVLSSPRALRWVVARCGPARVAVPPMRSEEREVARLGTEQLCKEWQASYRRVSEAASVAVLTDEMRRRQAVLDEMERRNATGFRTWLETSPTAYDDPECFLAAEVERKGPPIPD